MASKKDMRRQDLGTYYDQRAPRGSFSNLANSFAISSCLVGATEIFKPCSSLYTESYASVRGGRRARPLGQPFCFLRLDSRVGPFDRDVEDFGSQYDTYIVMDYIPGRTLEVEWDNLCTVSKTKIAQDLAAHMSSLRSLSTEHPEFIGSSDRGPVLDSILDNHADKGNTTCPKTSTELS
ncbi:hypothetical protein FH972_024032 [Carpinus fangiana]|uniref:Uncharacterized protein n=1 Tax=Carpinus fangiana TaxID=176857 RepID=A0A5N6KZC3_9ROSI|nr:hypothetical protein FH972_024032 [Carpinus fangiana]